MLFFSSWNMSASSISFRGASPLGLPYSLTRSPLRRLSPLLWPARCSRPLSAPSPLAVEAGFGAAGRRCCSSRAGTCRPAPFRSEGLRPSDSPTASLARRFAGSLHSSGLLAALARLALHLPLQSKPDSVQPDGDVVLLELEHVGQLHFVPRGFAPRTPLQPHSLAASPARSVRLARSLRSLASFYPRLDRFAALARRLVFRLRP